MKSKQRYKNLRKELEKFPEIKWGNKVFHQANGDVLGIIAQIPAMVKQEDPRKHYSLSNASRKKDPTESCKLFASEQSWVNWHMDITEEKPTVNKQNSR